MFFLTICLLPLLANAAFAISACGVCGKESGAMCIDDVTFSLCSGDTPMSGRYSCPQGMTCVDHNLVCVPTTTIQEGTPTCQTKCGKCSGTKRHACKSQTTFSLCYGGDTPSNITHKCPANTVCSITRDPLSRQFCFDPVTVPDEHMSCFPSAHSSEVFGRFIAAATPAAPTPAPEAAAPEAAAPPLVE